MGKHVLDLKELKESGLLNRAQAGILVRHASRRPLWSAPEDEHPIAGSATRPPAGESDFKTPGGPRTYALAGRLADQLAAETWQVTLILHSPHRVARQTAEIIGNVLKARGHLIDDVFASEALRPEADPKPFAELVKSEAATRLCLKNAFVVVGHQPQLTVIARELVKHLPGGGLPIGGSEMACIQLGTEPSLRWLITEKSEALLSDLKAKIASKFEVAKFFLGALVVSTGLTLNQSLSSVGHPVDKVLAGVGALLSLVSLGLTAATLFSYDRLLMPADFWQGGESLSTTPRWSVRRPPSQAHLIVYYEMIHIWTHFFIPALLTAFASLACFAVAMAHMGMSNQTPDWYEFPRVWWLALPLFVLAASGALAVGYGAFRRWKPRLGFDD